MNLDYSLLYSCFLLSLIVQVDDGGVTWRILPADYHLQREIQDISLAAYRAVGGTGYARVDLRRCDVSGKLMVLEVNANCGLANFDQTCVGEILRASDLKFEDLIARMIQDALARQARQRCKQALVINPSLQTLSSSTSSIPSISSSSPLSPSPSISVSPYSGLHIKHSFCKPIAEFTTIADGFAASPNQPFIVRSSSEFGTISSDDILAAVRTSSGTVFAYDVKTRKTIEGAFIIFKFVFAVLLYASLKIQIRVFSLLAHSLPISSPELISCL